MTTRAHRSSTAPSTANMAICCMGLTFIFGKVTHEQSSRLWNFERGFGPKRYLRIARIGASGNTSQRARFASSGVDAKNTIGFSVFGLCLVGLFVRFLIAFWRSTPLANRVSWLALPLRTFSQIPYWSVRCPPSLAISLTSPPTPRGRSAARSENRARRAKRDRACTCGVSTRGV